MVSYTVNGGTNIRDYRGLSSDEKPTDAPNGSSFYEMDTGDVYMFDKNSDTWILQ